MLGQCGPFAAAMMGLQDLRRLLCLGFVLFTPQSQCQKTYSDMFPHSHSHSNSPSVPHIHEWSPDNHTWDDHLYPPFKGSELKRHSGKSFTAHLTSDSPAISGSVITFTTVLEFPKCHREDQNGDLVYDEECQKENGHWNYIYNHSSWLDNYGYGKCLDPGSCDVFPDGTPFPESNDWSPRKFVYVWHTMGQYYQTCGGSSSSLKLNTTNITLGAEIMEVMVYRKNEHRKYTPAASDNGVYYVTNKIPLAVDISQKHPTHNTSGNIYLKDVDIVFKVLLHDPSDFLDTAAVVDFIWDFKDGNRLVTHSDVATHAYSTVANVTVKLVVQAAFRKPCPPPTTPAPTTITPTTITSPHTTAAPSPSPQTHAITSPQVTTHTAGDSTTGFSNGTTASPTIQPLATSSGEASTPGPNQTYTVHPHLLHRHEDLPEHRHEDQLEHHHHEHDHQCFHYIYGNFEEEIFIVDDHFEETSEGASKNVEVSAAQVSNTTVNLHIKCIGSIPTSVCTTISDVTCKEVKSITCDSMPASEACAVTLVRTFPQPGTYCINITLQNAEKLPLASTQVIVGTAEDVSQQSLRAPEVVISAVAVLLAIFSFIAFMVYKRYKVYRPIRQVALYQAEGEKSRLIDKPPV